MGLASVTLGPVVQLGQGLFPTAVVCGTGGHVLEGRGLKAPISGRTSFQEAGERRMEVVDDV